MLRKEKALRLTSKARELEEKLAPLQHAFLLHESILMHLNEALIFVNEDGKISFFNETASFLTGCEKEKVLSKPFWECFEDTLFGFSLQRALLKKETPRRIFLDLSNGNPLEVSFANLPQGVLITFRDAREMRQLKQTLDRHDRLKEIGEMGARLAHEIRNPLGGIIGFAELLARDLKEMPSLSKMAESIIEGSRLLNRLVTNILSYAKPIEVHLAKHNIGALIVKVKDLVLAEFPSKQCRVDAPAYFALVDKELFQMALLNFVRNAFEATKEGGDIAISLLKKENNIHITIQDEGNGIPKEHIEKIFTPFFTTKAKGSGLGLAEAHKIIHAHGGSIDVVSEEKKGSTFTIKLEGII